jgi:hypothetical protein
MAVRQPVLSDAAQARDIWNSNIPLITPWFPGGAAAMPTWTLDSARHFVQNPRRYTRVSTDAQGIRGIFSAKGNPQITTANIWLARLGGGAAATRTRFRASFKELLADWFNTATSLGIPQCLGGYSQAGNPSALEFLSDMSAANGVAPLSPGHEFAIPGWDMYLITPTQGHMGLTGIT